MRVGDLMTRAVVTTTATTSVDDAAAVLVERGVTALPVVADGGSLVGIVTEADVLRGRFPPDPRRKAQRGDSPGAGTAATVGEVMSRPALTATPGTDAAELARAMIERGLRSVPVLERGSVVGIVTRRDLVRTIARDDALIMADVRGRLEAFGGPHRWTVHAQQGFVTITDEQADPADHHVALVLAETVPGVVHVEVVHSAGPRLA